jgi:hypothetical protein
MKRQYSFAAIMKNITVLTLALLTGTFFGQVSAQESSSPEDSTVSAAMGGPISDDVAVAGSETDDVIEAAVPFNGVMNNELHDMIMSDSNYRFRTHWWTETCFSLDNDLSQMKGEIWLCLEDSLKPGFKLPVPGKVMSGFKQRGYRMHKGLDIDLKTGDTVYAAFSGRIRYSMFNNGGYGNLVIIRHYNGLETYYAHLSKLIVQSDEYVEAGQPIGLGGSTGRSYGPHLHFEVRFYDNALDPESLIDFEKGTLRDASLIVTKELFKESANGQQKILAMRSANSSVPATSGNGTYYRVRSGDSLWAISQRNGTSVSRLCQLNGLSERSVLQIGQTIRVK